MMNDDACDLVGYGRSESSEITLLPKSGCFKVVVFCLLIDSRKRETERLYTENLMVLNDGLS